MTRCLEDREKISAETEMLPYVFSATPVGRTIRRLRKERGLTQEEIAEQLGMTESKVKSMLFRTRDQLRRFLEKEEIAI